MNAKITDQLVDTTIVFFEPLVEAVSNTTAADQLLKDLGLGPFLGDISFSHLESLFLSVLNMVDTIEDLDGSTEATEYAELVIDLATLIGDLINAVNTISDFVSSAPHLATDVEVEKLPLRLLDLLLGRFLEKKQSGLYQVLRLLGLIRLSTTTDSDGEEYELLEIMWEKIPDYLSQPFVELEDFYVKTSGELEYSFLLERLAELGLKLGLPIEYQYTSPEEQEEFGSITISDEADYTPFFKLKIPLLPSITSVLNAQIFPVVNSDQEVHGMGIGIFLDSPDELSFPLTDDFELEVSTTTDLDTGVGFTVQTDGQLDFLGPLSGGGALPSALDLTLKGIYSKEDEKTIIFGSSGGSRLEFQDWIVALQFKKKNQDLDFGAELEVNGLSLVLEGGEGDGFLNKILPKDPITLDLDFILGFATDRGFYFGASGNLEFIVSLHKSLGPVTFQNVGLGIYAGEDSLALKTFTTLKVDLGPFSATVERIGVTAEVDFNKKGLLGNADLGFGFKPPTGIALSLTTATVSGGGYLFFDPDNERYGGALELAIADKLNVTAIGLVTTRMPDGSKGFSLLLIINVQFSPGIALGMGLFLSGLGGLVGINRTINVDALREGVKNNALDHILFPENVIENIDQIVSDIREIFPAQQDQFMFGVLAKITWGVPTLLSLEFGLVIELPNPVRIAILGVLKAVLPTEEEAILRLQINFVGIIDFEEGYLSFDASLYNSKILTITLEGDIAVRLNWGEEKGFLISVGGFHPSFQPPAFLKVGSMKRLTVNILSGNPSLTLTTYFAITSNTVQFGASIDFLFEVSKFKVLGYFGFDVLFQFSPFYFIASIRAGVEVKCGNTTLLSIKLSFELQGPKPWIASGTAEFKVLFIKVKVKFNVTWGDNQQDTLPEIEVLPQLLQAFEQEGSWISEIPTNRLLLVTLKETELQEGEVLMHSFGSLRVSQTTLPLDIEFTRFGENSPSDIKRSRVKEVLIDGESLSLSDARDAFAPANFHEMKDSDKLSSPSFVEEKSGTKLSDTESVDAGYGINHIVEYEVNASDYDAEKEEFPYELTAPRKLDKFRDNTDIFSKLTKGGAARKSRLSKVRKTKKEVQENKISLTDTEQFVIVNTDDLSLNSEVSFAGGTQAEADTFYGDLLKTRPDLKGKIQIVPDYHLADLELV